MNLTTTLTPTKNEREKNGDNQTLQLAGQPDNRGTTGQWRDHRILEGQLDIRGTTQNQIMEVQLDIGGATGYI